MPSADIRERLAEQQTALAQALTGGLPTPEGFDPARVAAAAEALARKRSRSVAKVWPVLTRTLGERFEERFAAFAATTALPEDGGPLADGRAFARHLAGELSPEAKLEVMAVDLHHATTARGLTPRRGFALRMAYVGRRLVFGFRLPWFGVRWLSILLGFYH